MQTITVTVRTRRQQNEYQDRRLAFWSDYVREARVRTNAAEDIGEYATTQEARLRNLLPRVFHQYLTGTPGFLERAPTAVNSSIRPGRLVVTVEAIRYGSMDVSFGIPDLDAFAEFVGNNSDTLEALFGAYVPAAFNDLLDGDAGQLQYEVRLPREVRERVEASSHGKTGRPAVTAKERGSNILAHLLQSPLIFPIILICFLWYYARQDMMAERQVTSGLIQTLVTEQTAVLSLLKDKQDSEVKPSAGADHATTHAPEPQPKKE